MSKIDQSDNSETESEPNSIETRTLRLISLTDVIRKEMEANDDLNASSTFKRDLQNSIKELIDSYMKERKFSETFIKREDVKQYLLESSPLDNNTSNDKDSESSTSGDDNADEIVVEVGTESQIDDYDQYQKLEKRLTSVEHKLNKIYKILTVKGTTTQAKEKLDTLLNSSLEKEKESAEKESKRNYYEEMFYERRENIMNTEFYKKSEETLKLNKRPAGTQFVPPPSIADMFPMASERLLNRPKFVKGVLRKDIKESSFMNQKS